MKIAVYLGSSIATEEFQKVAEDMGDGMASHGHQIIYGGASVGTMGILARAALRSGGTVIGVFPNGFSGRSENHHTEIVQEGLTELIMVEDMAQRKKVMESMSDACIIMPGSYGTFDEFFEYVVNKQVGFHNKPIYVLNHNGYYNPLKDMAENMMNAGFIKPGAMKLFGFYDTVEDIINSLK